MLKVEVCPAFPLVVMLLVANSTPIVDLDSKLNSSRVNLAAGAVDVLILGRLSG